MSRLLRTSLPLLATAFVAASPVPAAQAASACVPPGSDLVTRAGSLQIRVDDRSEDGPVLIACRRGRRRALRFGAGDNTARVLAQSGRWVVVATTFLDPPAVATSDDPPAWGISRLDLERGSEYIIARSSVTGSGPVVGSAAVTPTGDVIWTDPDRFQILYMLSRRDTVTELDAAGITSPVRSSRVTLRGDKVAWKPAGHAERRFTLSKRLARLATCFPRGGEYLLVNGAGFVRRVGSKAYVCLDGPARRRPLPGVCVPHPTDPFASAVWVGRYIAWACAVKGRYSMHVYVTSGDALLLRELTNIKDGREISFALSPFGGLAWVDRPAPDGKLTTMRLFVPGTTAVQSFDDGGERVAAPTWAGRRLVWKRFETTGPNATTRVVDVP